MSERPHNHVRQPKGRGVLGDLNDIELKTDVHRLRVPSASYPDIVPTAFTVLLRRLLGICLVIWDRRSGYSSPYERREEAGVRSARYPAGNEHVLRLVGQAGVWEQVTVLFWNRR